MEELTLEEKIKRREEAMQEYLDDVVPISEAINRAFEEIDSKNSNDIDEE